MRKTITCLIALLCLALPASALAGTGSSATAQKHLLSMYKVEKYISIDAADYDDDIWVSCNDSNDLAVDGMWRVDDVQWNAQLHDPGPYGPYNRYNGVDVFQSFSSDTDQWHFGIRNNSEEPAQLKVWITCLGNPTGPAEGDGHRHSLSLSALHTDPVTHTLAAGSVTKLSAGDYTCPAGQMAVAAGYWVDNGGTVKLYRSWPEDTSTLREWELGFYAPDDPDVHTSMRCLDLTTGAAGAKNHRHKLKVAFRSSTPTITAGRTDAVKQDCGEQEKALIGGFDVRWNNPWGGGYTSHNLWYLGMEPQIKSRVFHIQNWTSHDEVAHVGAICVNDRTGIRVYH